MQSSSTDRPIEFFFYKGEDKTLGQFSTLDESKKADKPALDLSWVVFTTWIRAR
jgi:hypothetical protein